LVVTVITDVNIMYTVLFTILVTVLVTVAVEVKVTNLVNVVVLTILVTSGDEELTVYVYDLTVNLGSTVIFTILLSTRIQVPLSQ
jgi:hypothetical protein